jgi:Bacterial SH3 domain
LENPLTAGAYIKIAMVMGIAFVAVLFLLVYRLVQLPAQPRAVGVRQADAGAGVSDTGTEVTATATATATATSVIMAEAKQYPNVHVTPGLSSRTVGVFNQGTNAEVLGRSADSVWLEIRYPQPQSPNGVGWVSTDLVSLSAPIASVPVVNAP